MNIAFTICSINYLGQAFTLGKSLAESNPDVEFRIYVIDKFLEREEIKIKSPFKIIEIEEVKIDCFEKLFLQYDIVELNTAVKPFIIDYIFKTEDSIQNIIYFDPDIIVLNKLEALFFKLIEHSIVLTPHILTPCDKNPYGQDEVNFLSTGIFNLGFIAFSRKEESYYILEWWKEKLEDQGYNNHAMHTFYDQKWMNFAPVFFNKVHIEKDEGYNMAAWNLHERFLTKQQNKYMVNQKALIFYHFSGVGIENTDISKYTKYSFDNRLDLIELINHYRKEVIMNGYHDFKNIGCFYILNKSVPILVQNSLFRKIQIRIKTILKSL